MIMTTVFFTLPGTNIQTLAPPQQLDFFDSQSVQLSQAITPVEAWRIEMSRPKLLLQVAFYLRDGISSVFGVEKIKGFSGLMPDQVELGQRLDFFLVEHVSDTVLTLTARDRHLDVATCVSLHGSQLSISSSVKRHNLFGWFYMLVVGPAHKLIVRNTLRNIQKAVEQA